MVSALVVTTSHCLDRETMNDCLIKTKSNSIKTLSPVRVFAVKVLVSTTKIQYKAK